MPLSMVQTGSKVKLVSICGERGLQNRLAELGLSEGSEIEVINNQYHEPFIISVEGLRLVIGHGTAWEIEVR